ncbi:MAG TPA: zinc metalloprotease HtpX [Bacillota bacterium]
MYQQIASNVRRSWLLMFVFALLIGMIAYTFARINGMGYPGVALAVLIAIGVTWVSYWYSDKMVLSISRAKPLAKEENPYLYNIVEALAIGAGVPAPRVYVIEDTAPNAFATGRDPRHAVIAVTTGLLQKMDRLELEGVIAHEMSHIRNRDILLMTIAVTMAGVVTLLSDWMVRYTWRSGRARRRDNRGGGNGAEAVILLAGLVMAILAPLFASLMQLAISRQREYLADSSAALLTRYPKGLADALRKIAADPEPLEVANKATAHLYIYNPLKDSEGHMDRLFDTHPPVTERIKRLEAMTF